MSELQSKGRIGGSNTIDHATEAGELFFFSIYQGRIWAAAPPTISDKTLSEPDCLAELEPWYRSTSLLQQHQQTDTHATLYEPRINKPTFNQDTQFLGKTFGAHVNRRFSLSSMGIS